jgi:hypothetical protein
MSAIVQWRINDGSEITGWDIHRVGKRVIVIGRGNGRRITHSSGPPRFERPTMAQTGETGQNVAVGMKIPIGTGGWSFSFYLPLCGWRLPPVRQLAIIGLIEPHHSRLMISWH